MAKRATKNDTPGGLTPSPAVPDENGTIPILPTESLSEEEFDRYLVQSGILDALLAQAKSSPTGSDWETELNEL